MKSIPETVYYHYFNALIDGDKTTCMRIVQNLIDEDVEIKNIFTELLQRSMYRIGHLWEHNRTTIAKEHIATKITESILSLLYSKVTTTEKNGRKVVVSCVDKEFHELGPKMVSDFFELNGWESIYLGASTPDQELIETIKQIKPDLVGISNNFYINIIRLVKLINLIKHEFPDQEIIVGGQALGSGQHEILKQFKKVKYIGSLNELETYLNKSEFSIKS
ncbi:MAG: cobalamin-dependent protein [Melioribacteraceae bacterium]|nr:cobalamin-dependent protein [Melioribacteraceae bacterium]MCF8356779.1 cobalamin-dependent protein [Melioribacteraceae bacterium]MCF8396151.1 cobalamin-dependent protein [Melioribacteraceae bacterium]MCF8421111.1 cobalamin-dependent protein [Melioribacteraceae bacterium]